MRQRILLGRRLNPTERAMWLHRASRKLLTRWRIEFSSRGKFPNSGMVVANHLSYLDILLFSAVAPCVFIAKREVRSWPVFGPLAKAAGTIFVDRENIRDTVHVIRQVQEALQHGVAIVLFPEGTSSGGASVLRFRSSLFEAAIRSRAPITPAYVSYRWPHGIVWREICYWGDMNFAAHLLKLLAKEGIAGKIHLGNALESPSDRKAAANASHQAVVQLSSVAEMQGSRRLCNGC